MAEDSKHRAGRLPRNVWALSWVSFFNDTSTEMSYWLLPQFLVGVLGAGPMVFGLIEGAAETVSSFGRLLSGWLSDRYRMRKPLVAAGYTAANVVKPFLAVATTWGQVFWIRFTDRAAKGFRGAPRDALLADSVSQAHRGSAFGLRQAMDTAGALLGPLAALALLPVFSGKVRTVFWLAAIPGAVAILLAWLAVSEVRPADGAKIPHQHRKGGASAPPCQGPQDYSLSRGPDSPLANGLSGLRDRKGAGAAPSAGLKPRPSDLMAQTAERGQESRIAPHGQASLDHVNWNRTLVVMLVAVGLFSLGNSSDLFLILRAQNLGVRAALAPALGLLFNLVYTSLSWPAGKLSDRVPRRILVVLGYFIYAAVYLGFALSRGPRLAWILFAVYGTYYATTEGVLRAWIADLVPSASRGSIYGVFNWLAGVAAFPASLLAGWLWRHYSPATPFFASAGFSFMAAAMLLLA
jgi:MFS family permease